jgi:tripartite-type tricarboxylate transporter receptor subunit TctC
VVAFSSENRKSTFPENALSFVGEVPAMTALVARRELLLGLAALPLASPIAVAETYPSRPVRILVATSAGGGTDLVAPYGPPPRRS